MRKPLIYGILALCLAGGTYGAVRYAHKIPTSLVPESITGPGYKNSSDVPDFGDDKVMLGLSHNVFVGKILDKVGDEAYPPNNHPSTQFEAKVIVNIKGNLQGTIIITQSNEPGPLAQVGATYVFSARVSRATGWYGFGDPRSYILLTADANASDSDLKALADKNDRVAALRDAYPHEMLVAGDQVYNSYNSRHYDAAGTLIDDTVTLAQQRPVWSPAFAPSSSPTSNDRTPDTSFHSNEGTPDSANEAASASATPQASADPSSSAFEESSPASS